MEEVTAAREEELPSTSRQTAEEREEWRRPRRPSVYRVPQARGFARYDLPTSPDEVIGDDAVSCTVVLLTFWFFVSMTLIMGIFGSEDFQLGPYSSILLQPNPLFVQYLKMEASNDLKVAPLLYGFYRPPPMGVNKTWSHSVNAVVKPDYHKEWEYYLNGGSQINISYNVPGESSLMLIIAKGVEGLAEWLEDPSYSDSTMSWNIIRGNGTIRQDILKSYDYYVAVGNFNSEDQQVELNFSIRASMHDIRDSYYKCNLVQGLCNLKIPFPGGNAAVLTTPEPQEGAQSQKVYVKVSYEPRWMTYFLGIGGMTSIMLWIFNFLSRFRRNNQDTTEDDLGPERAPLLSQKDDEISSLGSSYDSGSQNDEENEEDLEQGLLEGKSAGEGGRKSNPRLCVICFDAPKDCFFIPCGHCASCFACGIRIAEAAGTCPICRRRMKKVRRIYTV